MKGRMISTIITLSLVLAVSSTTLADPLSDQLKNQQSQLQQNKNSLKQTQDQREELEIKVEMLDDQIQKAITQIDATKRQIVKTQDDIKIAENDLNKAEQDIQEEQQLFNKRMRAMYINGVDSYLDVILSSKNVSDLLSRVESVRKIIQYDKKIVKNLNDKKDVIHKKKDALAVQNTKLLTLKADNEHKLAKLSDSKKEQNKLLADIKKQEILFASKIKQSQTLISATKKRIEEIRKKVPKYNPSRGAAPLTSNSLIAYASNFLGTNYVWGGTSPNPGFDCSGFVQYVYGHFGVSLGRTTYDQVTEGSSVSRDQLQPGDLVFFGSSSAPHHVGIYVGEGMYIHAPRTGDVIKISELDRPDYCGARRVK